MIFQRKKKVSYTCPSISRNPTPRKSHALVQKKKKIQTKIVSYNVFAIIVEGQQRKNHQSFHEHVLEICRKKKHPMKRYFLIYFFCFNCTYCWHVYHISQLGVFHHYKPKIETRQFFYFSFET